MKAKKVVALAVAGLATIGGLATNDVTAGVITPRLTLEIPGDCLRVELWMRDLDSQLVTGFQAFLEFDPAFLNFDDQQSGYNDVLLSQHISTMDTALVAPGQLNLDGSDPTNVGTSDDMLLATLVFTAKQGFGPTTVGFRVFGPFVSELSYLGVPILTDLVGTPPCAVVGPCFGVNNVVIQLVPGAGDDRLIKKVEIKGTWHPALPIDLAVDDVTYTIDDGHGQMYSFFIPAGSFETDGDPEEQKFRFDSPPGSEFDIEAKFDFRECEFEIKVRLAKNNPKGITGTNLTIGLQAGANVGQEVVEMEEHRKHLEHKKHPKLDCCEPDGDDWCASGKPRVLTMRYTGDGCDATSHSQDSGKVSCEGDPTFEPVVYILAIDRDDPDNRRVKIWFDDMVALGETFDVDAANAGASRLKGGTFVHVYDLGGTLLQTVGFHTSCSQPLNQDDQFGSLLLLDFIPE
jgi:hypothetical protein